MMNCVRPILFMCLLAGLMLCLPGKGHAQDKRGSFSIIVENDLFAGTDRHYTNGIKASWLSAENDLPDFGRWLVRNLPLLSPNGQKRIGYAMGQNIYTPDDISIRPLQRDDRPYAGWLYGEVGLLSETGVRLDSVAISLGVIGPLSQADDAQKIWHGMFDFSRPEGWDHQLKNEPAMNITFDRQWRNILRQNLWFGMQIDATPHFGASLGNVYTHGAGGLMLRLGEDLQDDFGPPRIRPSLPGASHFKPSGKFGWYLFGGVEGRAVLRNIFLDGNSFTSSHHVDKKMLVGDLQFGVAFLFPRFRITYTQVLRTLEFKGQDHPDHFGAISLTARF